MADTTTNRGWTIPTESSDPWYTAFKTLMNAVDTDAHAALTLVKRDTLANRPAAGASPTTVFFLATDVERAYFNTGSEWIELGGSMLLFPDVETTDKRYRIAQDQGVLRVQMNIGTVANPVWVSLIDISPWLNDQPGVPDAAVPHYRRALGLPALILRGAHVTGQFVTDILHVIERKVVDLAKVGSTTPSTQAIGDAAAAGMPCL